MANTGHPSEKTLAELGANDPLGVEDLFAQERERFDQQVARHSETGAWAELRLHWLGRKGVLSEIKENWLTSSPPGLRSTVGRSFNELRAHIEKQISELQKVIEA